MWSAPSVRSSSSQMDRPSAAKLASTARAGASSPEYHWTREPFESRTQTRPWASPPHHDEQPSKVAPPGATHLARCGASSGTPGIDWPPFTGLIANASRLWVRMPDPSAAHMNSGPPPGSATPPRGVVMPVRGSVTWTRTTGLVVGDQRGEEAIRRQTPLTPAWARTINVSRPGWARSMRAHASVPAAVGPCTATEPSCDREPSGRERLIGWSGRRDEMLDDPLLSIGPERDDDEVVAGEIGAGT